MKRRQSLNYFSRIQMTTTTNKQPQQSSASSGSSTGSQQQPQTQQPPSESQSSQQPQSQQQFSQASEPYSQSQGSQQQQQPVHRQFPEVSATQPGITTPSGQPFPATVPVGGMATTGTTGPSVTGTTTASTPQSTLSSATQQQMPSGSTVLTSGAGQQEHVGVKAGGEGKMPTADIPLSNVVMSSEPISQSLKERMSSLFQSYKPINQIHEHLTGIHCYHGEPLRQVQTHHYCSNLSEDFRQCIIFDSNKPDAKLIGVEYVISARVFQQLPEEEKAYWHPHVYEVKSGIMAMVGVPDTLEDSEMTKLINTYGKTWHLWQVDRGDMIPMGPAKLMSTFHMDGEVDERLLEERDRELGMSTSSKRGRRIHFSHTPIDRAATA